MTAGGAVARFGRRVFTSSANRPDRLHINCGPARTSELDTYLIIAVRRVLRLLSRLFTCNYIPRVHTHLPATSPTVPASAFRVHSNTAFHVAGADPGTHQQQHGLDKSCHSGQSITRQTRRSLRSFLLTFISSLQVGGPSRGTRFRPLSLDVPKVRHRRKPPLRTPHCVVDH